MPRTHIPGASNLRNRNRITNKTRLKIVRGNVEGEDLLIPDEDEEKHRLTNLVAGVDAEDANEHHLQEVLSAAHRTKKAEEKAAAFIPTPDSTGLVDNSEELYPAGVWKDPATFNCTSTTVEESVRDGLANGFSYFMDERDKEWLDKNNEEARGEGTSAQGAISSASGTRTSARSAKAKGKEPDLNQPVVISEDEFELVMGLFEKVTHEKTEFLHHSLETGMPFPAFSEYQDVFSSPLPPATFATFFVPTWIPQPQQLLRIARTVYPYWKERRIERAGHRIIPTLNFDESDTLNESYICFRRREIKAVRKTRQAQVTSSDKLARLQAEFAYPLELARHVLQRETIKKEQAQQAQLVWERRMALADLKRKFPSFADKTDEDLLVDKERPVKKPEPSRLPVRIPANNGLLQPLRPDPVIKPRERISQVKDKTDAYLARRKEEDKIWEDVVDNPFQTPYTPFASRLFRFIPPPSAPSWPTDASDKTSESDDERPSSSRAIRLRYSRNGRLFIDRRDFGRPQAIRKVPRSSLFGGDEDVKMDVDEEDPEEVERTKRQEERWRFDQDDAPPSPTADESVRTLVDEYDPKYLRHSMMALSDIDHQMLATDPTLYLPTVEGRQLTVVPWRIGYSQAMVRNPHFRPPPPGMLATPPGGAPANGAPGQNVPVGTSVSLQHLKKMPPPTMPQMRISSNGGMRPPSVPASALPSNGATQQSPPQPLSLPAAQHAPVNGVNGTGRAAIAMPHVEMVKPVVEAPVANGTPPAPTPASTETTTITPANQEAVLAAATNGVPARPKSQNQVPIPISNGFHVNPAAAAFGNYQLPNGQGVVHNMSPQKMQELKTFISNMPPQQLAAFQVAQTNRAAFAQTYGHAIHGNGNGQTLQIPANMPMKLPGAVRQLQWPVGTGMQRPPSAMNGIDGVNGTLNGVASPSPQHMNPVRSPSTNGIRPGMRVASNGLQMSPLLQHSPSPMPNISQSQSPPRHPLTPTVPMASPPLQHQPPVGSTQNGY